MKKPTGLYQRGETWWLTWRADGKKKFSSLKTTDYQAAVGAAVKLKAAKGVGARESLAAARDRFIADKTKTGIYTRHSGEWVKTPLLHLEKFAGPVTPGSISSEAMAAFAADLRKRFSDTSAASYMRAVRSFFSWLEANGEIAANPCAKLKLPKPRQSARTEVCTGELRDRLIEKAPDDDLRLVLLLGFHAGLRKNEIIEARQGWIDGATLNVEPTESFRTKSGHRRAVPMTAALSAHLATRARGAATAFLIHPEVERGKALYRYDFRAPFEAHMKAMECEWVTPHTMRRTFASLLVSAGVSIYKVARWLGDSVAVTEKHYAHLTVADSDIERSHG